MSDHRNGRRSSESKSPDRDRGAARDRDRDRDGKAETAKEKDSAAGKNSSGLDRERTCPLLLRVFCSTSRHNPMSDYSKGKVPANELQIYTWLDATLKELTSLVKEVNPDSRRRGTFFDFAVVYPMGGSRSSSYTSRDIGTTVAGQKGPDDSKTLKDCRFVIGDYLDIAITPPLPEDRGYYGGGGRRGGGGFGGGRGGGGGGGGSDRRFRPY